MGPPNIKLLHCVVGLGQEHSLEVLELEPEVRGEESEDDQGEEGDQVTPDKDASALEFNPPKMKLCLGKVAAGLRIRNGPGFTVGCELCIVLHAVQVNMLVFFQRRDNLESLNLARPSLMLKRLVCWLII